MDAIKQKVGQVLPKLDEATLKLVLEKIEECGVEDVDDVKYIQESDLTSILKPVQVRKLLQVWKMEGKSLYFIV